MAYYIDEENRLEWIDDKNIAFQEKAIRVNKDTQKEEIIWNNVSYHPNLHMAFNKYLSKNINNTEIENDFEKILNKIDILTDKYHDLANKLQKNIEKYEGFGVK